MVSSNDFSNENLLATKIRVEHYNTNNDNINKQKHLSKTNFVKITINSTATD